jgi:hypothetical protein
MSGHLVSCHALPCRGSEAGFPKDMANHSWRRSGEVNEALSMHFQVAVVLQFVTYKGR